MLLEILKKLWYFIFRKEAEKNPKQLEEEIIRHTKDIKNIDESLKKIAKDNSLDENIKILNRRKND